MDTDHSFLIIGVRNLRGFRETVVMIFKKKNVESATGQTNKNQRNARENGGGTLPKREYQNVT